MGENFKKEKAIIDPRTLLLINIIFSIGVFIVSSKGANHLFFTISFTLMLIVGLYKESLNYILVYGTMVILDFVFIKYNMESVQIFVGLIFYMVGKMIPIMMIASILVKRTKTNQVITSLERMKIPKGIMLSIVVSLRFVPTIKEEMRYIKESMSMRGVELSFKNLFKNPVRTVEYSLIPLLFRSLKIAEELTATGLTRGVENDIKRSSYFDVSFRKLDYFIICFVMLSIFIVFMIDRGLIKI